MLVLLYFVVFFAPLALLGRKRVMDECSFCGAHRSVGLAEWEKAKRTEIEQALLSFEKDPRDHDLTRRTLEVLIEYQDYQAFNKVAPAIENDFNNEVDIVRTLAQGYSLFEAPEKAENAYRRWLALEDSDEAHEGLALVLMRPRMVA